jgi:glycosyltransferase involved in cell wall biosynthesis
MGFQGRQFDTGMIIRQRDGRMDKGILKNPGEGAPGLFVTLPVCSRVLVAVQSFNEEAHIRECLESLKAQMYREFKVLISDNASTDRTEAEIEAVISDDPRFVYVRQKENLGIVGNFNFLLDSTECDFLLVMGAHDTLSPDFLQVTISALEKAPDAILAYSDVQDIDENSKPIGIEEIPDYATEKNRTSLQRLFRIPEAMLINQMLRRSAMPVKLRAEISIGCDLIFLSILHYWGPTIKCPGLLYRRRYFKQKKEKLMARLGGKNQLEIINVYRYACSFSRAVWRFTDEPVFLRGGLVAVIFFYVFTFQIMGNLLKFQGKKNDL